MVVSVHQFARKVIVKVYTKMIVKVYSANEIEIPVCRLAVTLPFPVMRVISFGISFL